MSRIGTKVLNFHSGNKYFIDNKNEAIKAITLLGKNHTWVQSKPACK